MPTNPARTRDKTVDRDKWLPFLAEFTQLNLGAHASVEVIGRDIGDQVIAEGQPFGGISADLKDGECTVWITFGATSEGHFTHSLRDVTAIRELPGTDQSGSILELESRDGSKTLLTLSRPGTFTLSPGKEREPS